MNGAREQEPGPHDAADEPVLPDVSRDERDEARVEDSRSERRDEQWYRRERPPHHE